MWIDSQARGLADYGLSQVKKYINLSSLLKHQVYFIYLFLLIFLIFPTISTFPFLLRQPFGSHLPSHHRPPPAPAKLPLAKPTSSYPEQGSAPRQTTLSSSALLCDSRSVCPALHASSQRHLQASHRPRQGSTRPHPGGQAQPQRNPISASAHPHFKCAPGAARAYGQPRSTPASPG